MQILVFFTDLYGKQPDQPPSHPVLLASTGSQHAPFGRLIPMQAAETHWPRIRVGPRSHDPLHFHQRRERFLCSY